MVLLVGAATAGIAFVAVVLGTKVESRALAVVCFVVAAIASVFMLQSLSGSG